MGSKVAAKIMKTKGTNKEKENINRSVGKEKFKIHDVRNTPKNRIFSLKNTDKNMENSIGKIEHIYTSRFLRSSTHTGGGGAALCKHPSSQPFSFVVPKKGGVEERGERGGSGMDG